MKRTNAIARDGEVLGPLAQITLPDDREQILAQMVTGVGVEIVCRLLFRLATLRFRAGEPPISPNIYPRTLLRSVRTSDCDDRSE